MTTQTTRLDQLPDEAMQNLLSFLPSLADKGRFIEACPAAKAVFHGSLHQTDNGYSQKKYRFYSIVNGSGIGEYLRHPHLPGLRYKGDSISDLEIEEAAYFSKKRAGIEVKRAKDNHNTLDISHNGATQRLNFPQDQPVYDFAIEPQTSVLAISTSAGLHIYALEEGNSGTPKKIADFSRFRFHTLIFTDQVLSGIEPEEKLFTYSWKMTGINFASDFGTTHILDNPVLFTAKEVARKVGLFLLRSLIYLGIIVAAVAALTLVIASIIAIVHAAGLITATVGTGALFLEALLYGSLVAGAFALWALLL